MHLFRFIIFLAVIVCSHQNEFFLKESNVFFKHTQKFMDVCLKETGLSKKMLDDFELNGEIPADKGFICFMYCMGAKSGFLTENDSINFDMLASQLEITNKEIMDEMKSKCKFSKDEFKCSAARDAVICFVEILSFHQT